MRPKFLAGTFLLIVLAGAWIFLGISSLSPQASGGEKTAFSEDLDSVLKTLAAYCERLESAAFDFVCLEEIKETIDPVLDLRKPQRSLKDWVYWDFTSWSYKAVGKIKNSYLFDYQCIRSNRETREVRTLLKKNGRKKHEPNAQLKTAVVVFRNALFWPMDLFGERAQSHYDYKIIGEGEIQGRPVLVIDATPKAGVPETTSLYGKSWIDKETLDLLKIEWNEQHISRYDIVTARAERYKRTPRIRLRSEFEVQKNGIRFPTSLFVEEAYLNSKGRAFIRSLTTVVYRNFKFFTVEVEIR